MRKKASSDHRIVDPLSERWSPRSFSERPVDGLTLRRLFEAARWAPSCFNEQPWQFIVARDDDARQRVAACLTEKNRRWAAVAPILGLVCARTTFSAHDRPNRHYAYDTGQAMAGFAAQATTLGLSLHQMAGFDADAARTAFGVPDGVEPLCAFALGYAADPGLLPEDLQERERAPRRRKPQSDFVYEGRHGTSLTTAEEADIHTVLHFWFGERNEHGFSSHPERWWQKDPDFDREVRDRFGALHDRALAGGLETWLSSREGRVAYVLVLDQFSRNIHRDTPRMYHGDRRALDACLDAVEQGVDRELEGDPRAFLYMPLMHSEEPEDQALGVTLFERWLHECPAPRPEPIAKYLDYARRHQAIVVRFGRFPHRNALLTRASTPAERDFLEQDGSRF
jgi:uncharacterized protein (DUF924 family)/nitroreductase